MKKRVCGNEIRALIENPQSFDEDVLEAIDVVKFSVRDDLLEEGKESLCGLELGRVRWEEHEVVSFGDHKRFCGVPTSTIEHQTDLTVRSSPDLLGKVCQNRRHDGSTDGLSHDIEQLA